MKKHLLNADGYLFPLKLCLLECFETLAQFYSLLSSSKTSDGQEVLISAIVISTNMILLPGVVLISDKYISTRSTKLAMVLSLEIFFDKIFTGVAVLLRPDTLTAKGLNITDQLARHGGCLIPALMTVLDVQDALFLVHYKEKDKKSRASTRESVYIKSQRYEKYKKYFLYIGCTISICLGLLLGTYSITTYSRQKSYCHSIIGSIEDCARPRLYYLNGFFSKTTCT